MYVGAANGGVLFFLTPGPRAEFTFDCGKLHLILETKAPAQR
jgi:hypothetical protein